MKISYEKALSQGITKKCNLCLEHKALSMYNKSIDCAYGVKANCKTCRSKQSKNKRANLKQIEFSNDTIKKCGQCSQNKTINLFDKYKLGKMGVSNMCKACKKDYSDNYRVKNKDELKLKKQEYVLHNKEIIRQRDRDSYAENPLRKRMANKKWSGNNPDKINALSSKRRARKIQRTREYADGDFIGIYYYISKRMSDIMGEVYHVDHIIPLQGKMVSGFHHQGNLQVMRGGDNLSKGNKY